MNLLTWMIDNWFVVIGLLCVVLAVIGGIWHFYNEPSQVQIQKVKEWLLLAVTQAEKELGGGTGQLKLRYVYDLFLTKFPWLAKIISFAQFSLYVDEALEKMKEMLKSNVAVQNLVKGDEIDGN